METNTGTQSTTSNRGTRIAAAIARILLGIAFMIFGLNGFLNFIKPPPNMPEDVITISMALMKGGYMNVVSVDEILVAVLLLSNRFVPLALALLAPIIVGILTFHIAVQPSTIAPGIVVAVLELFLAWTYRKAFCPMLRAKNTAGLSCE